MSSHNADSRTADVVVVGAGPAGATAAAYLAADGLDVVLLEKATFPRDKICGDGLTPRAVKELVSLGVPHPAEEGWIRNRGLRLIGGGHLVEVDWPDVAEYPAYGLAMPRTGFDHALARHAVSRGARLVEGASVTGPIHDSGGRVTGVRVKGVDARGRATGERFEYRAPVVLAADGNSARLGVAEGRRRRDDRPMGVGVRTYYETPRSNDDYMESWMELWVDKDPKDPSAGRILLPGYGWIFALGDGASNVGLGILDTSPAFGTVDYKDVLRRWVATLPPEWTFDEEHRNGQVRGAALPMALGRVPHYADGLLLLGDAGGMISPFNGEGIAHAMEAARLSAEIVAQAMTRPDAAARDRVLARYPAAVREEMGGYFRLGTVFASLIGHPEVMRLAVRYGLPRRTLMRFVVKIMAGLAEPHGGGLDDRVISTLARLTPSA
ncbi:geranylgeranyl reductase family protein [Mobilicoccus massiliensis]|uniref:geranylgeranyl reductase family protein n=1 Tax=Mobilicoccus massiliensis TaxID=1522310 RepID=UPI00058FE379|nr:geranylgeranyl reductase family protein [Mobilicoccus massiliensis]